HPYLQRIAENADSARNTAQALDNVRQADQGAGLTICDQEASSLKRAVMGCARSSFCCNSRYRRGCCPLWSIDITFAQPKATFHVQSAEERAPVSPHEIMTKQGGSFRSNTGSSRRCWRGQRNGSAHAASEWRS